LLMRCHAEFSAGNRLYVLGPSKAWLDRQSPNLGATSKADKVKPPILPLPHLVGLVERNMLEWLLCHRRLLPPAPSISSSRGTATVAECEQLRALK
jgi:hypothetical protein